MGRGRPSLRSEDGFTLIELMATLGVVLVALLALAYTASVGFGDIALARQRQSANGLANQTMEQLRALPFDTIKKGMDNTDLATSGDSNITSTGSGPSTVYWFQGEPIPRGANANVVPLVPHRRTVQVGPTVYTVSAYVTYYQGVLTANTFRVTVEVLWTPTSRGGASGRVQTQSIFYSGAGCLSTTTHPFAAPCQPFLYSSAVRGESHLDLTGTLAGINLDHASLVLPSASSSTQIEQVSAVQGITQTSGVKLQLVGQAESVTGLNRATSASDNDPGASNVDFQTSTAAAQGATTLSENGGGDSVSVTSSGGDTAVTTSTISASTSPSHPCPDRGGVNQVDGQPCGNSNARQMGIMSGSVTLNRSGANLGAATFASAAAAASSSAAFTNRDVTPEATMCTLTSGDGCIHGDLNRSIGSVSLAGLPAALPGGSRPPGWSNYLVTISNFTDAVSAEAGTGTVPPTVTASGTISYYNGAGYTTLPIVVGPSVSLPVAPVHILDLSRGILTIDITSSLKTGGTSASATVATCSPTPCPNTRTASEATSNSPVTGDISYVVVFDGLTVADLKIHVDLGTISIDDTYQQAPSGA